MAIRRHFIDATRDEVKSMKDKMSINRNRDRDITARQPLLDNSPKQQQQQSQQQQNNIIIKNNISNTNSINTNSGINLIQQAGAMASRHSGAKYSKLENAIDSPGHYASNSNYDSPSGFVNDTMSSQQRMLQSQDDQLDVISDSIGTLKTVSRQINVELDEQAV